MCKTIASMQISILLRQAVPERQSASHVQDGLEERSVNDKVVVDHTANGQHCKTSVAVNTIQTKLV